MLSYVWFFATPWTYNLPGSSLRGILQARILEWVAIAFSRRSSWPRGWTQVSCIAGRFFMVWATREAQTTTCVCVCVSVCVCESLSCVQLCDPMDCSPPGSSIKGILQARVLEWVAISLSILTHKKKQNWVSCSEVDEPRVHHTELSKSEREKQMSVSIYTYGI